MDTNSVIYPPIPEGATFLFENQDKPFAGDTFMERDFLALRERFGIQAVIETGTCYGSTTLWLAEHFDRVMSVEINPDLAAIAQLRAEAFRMNDCGQHFDADIEIEVGDSGGNIFAGQIDDCQFETLMFFLDAHFEKHCPLLDELSIIAATGIKPVIAIHDFKVPDRPDLGFDTWNGQPFTFEWIKKHIEAIYGPEGYAYNYNSEATGARRGVIYIYPKQ